jgi:hypothetical protein
VTVVGRLCIDEGPGTLQFETSWGFAVTLPLCDVEAGQPLLDDSFRTVGELMPGRLPAR